MVRAARRGFTLVELLVVLGIIAVLLGLILPAVQRVRESANRARCLNNMKQLGLACHQYHDAGGSLPPGISRDPAIPYPFMAWCARLLPYLERGDLWREAQSAYAQEPFFLKNPPHTGLGTAVPAFACPAAPETLTAREGGIVTVAFTAYLGVEGTDQYRKDGTFYLDSHVRLADLTDGTSGTVIVGERPPSPDGGFGWWYAGWGQAKDGSCDSVLGARELNVVYRDCPSGPYAFSPGSASNQCDIFHYWSRHAGGGANFLFGDGAVRFVPYSAATIIPALATRAGREAAALPD